MTIRAIASGVIAATLLTTASSAAFAQRFYDRGYYDAPGYNEQYAPRSVEPLRNPYPYAGASDRYGYPASGYGRACVKLCPQDNNPCDPIYFKTGDNRCLRNF